MLRKEILYLLFVITFLSLFSDEIKQKGLHIQGNDSSEFKRWAILIGVNDYRDIAINKLSKSKNDAKSLEKVLKEQGEFDEIILMTDDMDPKGFYHPTKNNIESKFEALMNMVQPEDFVLFYFSGHGISDKEENAYILPIDVIQEKAFETSVSVNKIVNAIKEKGIKKSLLILDACRENATKTKGFSQNLIRAEKFQESEVTATFFGTKSGGFSIEDPDSDNGLFTRFLVEAMKGNADDNADGIITFSELENYVSDKVSKYALKYNKQQKPFVRYNKEKSGDIPITLASLSNKKKPTFGYELEQNEKNANPNNSPSKEISKINIEKKESFAGKNWSQTKPKASWIKAVSTCNSLGMRIPSPEELNELYESPKVSWKKKDCASPCIYWSTEQNENFAFTVSMEDGYKSSVSKTNQKYIKCISD